MIHRSINTFKFISQNVALILFFGLLTSCTKHRIPPRKHDPSTVLHTSAGEFNLGRTYKINSKKYQTVRDVSCYKETALASWYGKRFHGKITASGDYFNSKNLTCAHRTLPIGSVVKVTNAENNKSIILTVTDRGPFPKKDNHNRAIDVSETAAKALGFQHHGIVKVTIEYLSKETKLLAKLKSEYITKESKLTKKQKIKKQSFVNTIVRRFNTKNLDCVSV